MHSPRCPFRPPYPKPQSEPRGLLRVLLKPIKLIKSRRCALAPLIDRSYAMQLGEVGLPWYSLQDAPDAASRMADGKARLERLLALASRYDLPVVLHAPHGAAVMALDALRRRRIERAVFHWHKAPVDVTRQIVERGYCISVTPEVVYRERDRELVQRVPLDSLLVESDAPWKYAGEFATLPSGPWLTARVAEEIAKIKRLPVEDTMAQLSANTCRVFDLIWA